MQQLLIFMLLFDFIHSLGLNQTFLNITKPVSNELPYSIVNSQEQQLSLLNETVKLDKNEFQQISNNKNEQLDATSTIKTKAANKNLFNKIMNAFDSYTLMLIAAFLIGLIVVALLILCAICIYKSINRDESKSRTPVTKITNPIYNNTNDQITFNTIEHEPLTGDDDIPMIDSNPNDSNEKDHLLKKQDHSDLNTDKNTASLVNTTTSASCSTLSVKSVVAKLDANDTLVQDYNTTLKNETNLIETQVEKSCGDNETINSSTPTRDAKKDEFKFPLHEIGSVKRMSLFTPSTVTKSQQQLFREQQLVDYKVSNKRLNTPSTNENDSSNRLSAASSHSSIHQTINFGTIVDEINDMAGNKEFSSRSNLTSSRDSSEIINDLERAESINEIYIKEMIRKQEEKDKKRQLKNDISISNYSISSSSIHKSKKVSKSLNQSSKSINVKFDPSNPDYDAQSVKTVESEKSCY